MPRRRVRTRNDALTLLHDDHVRIMGLFTQVARASSAAEARPLAERACRELELHSQLEEQLFYPAVRHELRDRACLEDGAVEHSTIDGLIEDLRGGGTDDVRFLATARVLVEHLAHHLKKEEQRIFPQVRRASIDLEGLGEQLERRRAEMAAQNLMALRGRTSAARAPRPGAGRYPGLAPF